MTRKTKRYGLGAALLVLAGAVWIELTDRKYLYKAVYHNFASIDDHTKFEQRKIKAPRQKQPWALAANYNRLQMPPSLQRLHQRLQSVAFLIVQRDAILYEQYWGSYGPASRTNSFSMAKSIVSILVGVAIKEGKIKSVEQRVGDFLPAFNQGDKASTTIRDLLWMSSGLNWDESYINPFSKTTEAYYGNNLKKVINRLEAEAPPGSAFTYKSSDTQVLGFVLQAATGQSLSKYAQEKLWKQLGAAHDAEWSVDHLGGIEKAYCCFYSNARDFARFGKLYLQNGLWNDEQIVPADYVKASLTPSRLSAADNGETVDFYGYHWWLLPNYKGQDIFYARGILGQYIIVIPKKDLIVVRLGKKRGPFVNRHPAEVTAIIDAVNEMVK